MSVDVQDTVPPGAARADWLSIRLASALIGAGGVLSNAAAYAMAEQQSATQQRRAPSPGQRLKQSMRWLLADEVVVLVDGVWYAPNIADLAAWLTDALEVREERGLPSNPVIPHARSAA